MGAMDATAASRLPPLFPRFRALCPEVTLTQNPAHPSADPIMVLDAALDCALVSLPRERLRPMIWSTYPSLKNSCCCASQPSACFCRLAEGCTYRAMGEAFLAHSEEVESEIRDVGSYHAMLACVASGGYAGIVPQSVLDT